jgi:hypothetical protein
MYVPSYKKDSIFSLYGTINRILSNALRHSHSLFFFENTYSVYTIKENCSKFFGKYSNIDSIITAPLPHTPLPHDSE